MKNISIIGIDLAKNVIQLHGNDAHGHTRFTRKLRRKEVLEFMINQNIVKASREKGTIIIFPSFILHRVTPITKGTRESMVGWVSGPPYR